MIPEPDLRVSIAIVGYNGARFLAACLDSLLAMDMPATEYELLYIDNASADESVAVVARHAARFPHHRIVRNAENLGFAASVNQAGELARARVLAVLNQDTVVDRGWISAILRAFDDPSVAVVGSRVAYEDGSGLYAAGLEVLYGGICVVHEGDRRVDAVSGCAIAFRLADFRRLGGLEASLFMYGEDLDFCRRARSAGHRVAYAADARVTHRASRRDRAGTRTYLRHMLRNRTLVCLRNYRWKRLYLALDGLVLFPLTATTEFLRSRDKARAVRWIVEARIDSLRAGRAILHTGRGRA